MHHPAAISPPAAGAMPVRGVDSMAYCGGASAGQLACAKVRQAEWHLHPHRHEDCAVCANTAAPAAANLLQLTSGKRFPQLKKRFDAEQNLSQFEPDIVVSKNFP